MDILDFQSKEPRLDTPTKVQNQLHHIISTIFLFIYANMQLTGHPMRCS